ncbi:hypothetical protein CRE_13148 [Caenorhabditis remanei]|uniref:Sdz-33 F-box domain-containing protein n=1 Tax=Caenorhabditis remanei TaxID=31234 RepID=E3NKS9_CAERE|nr:hypothetical protein CRE_13148 [Caenorhabditis remanei]
MKKIAKYLMTYWEDELTGLEAITDYVMDLFNIDVSEVYISKDSFKMIEWVNNRQKTQLKKVAYVDWNRIPSEEEMNYILKDCQCSSEILIYSEAPPNFRFLSNFRRIDCFDITDSKWVTIDNLLTMDGVDIVLGTCSLSSTDLNVFLKHWLSGGCPRLKFFLAMIDTVNILQLLDGLMDNAVVVENDRNYSSPFGYSETLPFGVDIQRADGVTATVCEQMNETLVIAVWPETTYNYI